jgi:hypothetical protein
MIFAEAIALLPVARFGRKQQIVDLLFERCCAACIVPDRVDVLYLGLYPAGMRRQEQDPV